MRATAVAAAPAPAPAPPGSAGRRLHLAAVARRAAGRAMTVAAAAAAAAAAEAAAAAASPSSSAGASPSRLLVAFDFDHSLVDGNTDTWVIRALPGGQGAALPASLKASYTPGRWTEYMQRVLEHLHDAGCSVADMQAALQTLPLTPGMPQLLGALAEAPGWDASCIVISDSNTHFIDWILNHRGWAAVFSDVYTNASEVQRGRLRVRPCHKHSCPTCPVNMCKRELLQRHAARSGGLHAHGQRVVYVGDGSNDLCPAQAMGPGDLLCVRSGYALDKLLLDPAVAASVRARVMRWSSGVDILEALVAAAEG